MTTARLITADCLEALGAMPADSVDLVFGSPPYGSQREYDIGFKLRHDKYVRWLVVRMMEMLRVSRGLVAMVVQGASAGNYAWDATPAHLIVALQRQNVCVRNPAIFKSSKLPGSGGRDWLRNDYEWIVCATESFGRLPWSDNTAMGWKPKHRPGGVMSNRTKDGQRINKRTGKRTRERKPYPERTNPGNVIELPVGGGHMGDKLAHENEAPFPLKLAEFFVRSFCPPGGTVLDPFGGSGTTAVAAAKHGRNAISIDIRESQRQLAKRRLALHANGQGSA